ncbi:MAG TPA: type II secretion system F family protein [Gammaproteobacteria bacterium]|nr:type II secretion system F family protein [Gammaproteobacteria bacterium]|tara:strand:- start:4686 stop:5882 length:1197 start_codon:yes stop_codon:yes gene_type:complete
MPAYNYTAFDAQGKKLSGHISALSERDARRLIKELNLVPLEIAQSFSAKRNILRVKKKSLILATRQMATLLGSSIPLDETLNIVANHIDDKRLKNVFYSIREDLIQGIRLGNAMGKFPDIFDNTYTSLVSAGDTSGNLNSMFTKLSDYLEESDSIRQKVTSALAYPLILIAFSILVIVALLVFVMPQVVDQFIRAGMDLPLLTRALLGFSNQLPLIGFAMLVFCIAAYFGYQKISSNPSKLISWHRRVLSLPLAGDFILKSELERFSSTMHLLLSSGINLDLAMQESSKVFSNKYLESLMEKSNKDLKEGKDFVVLLQEASIYPEIFIQLISSGFIAGNLPEMFEKVSAFMKSEIETKRSLLLALLEPMVIIFMGAFILLIVLAILIPIMQMNSMSIS